MKYLLFLLLSVSFFTDNMYGQTPQYINYQAALRHNNGDIVNNDLVLLRFSLLDGSTSGEVLYQETHEVQSNSQGIVNLRIGNGSVIEGAWEDVDWADDKKYLKIEVKEGASFTSLGIQQLVSVPFALHAQNTEAIAGRKVATTAPATGKVLKWNGSAWAPATDANTIAPAGAAGGDLTGNYPNPAIGINKITTAKINDASVTAAKLAANSVTVAKITNGAITTAKMANGAVTAAKLNAMGATTGQILRFNGSAWVPVANDGATAWSIQGNSNAGSSKFLGSTNSNPVHFRTHNMHAGMLSVSNVSFGSMAGDSISGNAENTSFGYRANYTPNGTGSHNTAVGGTTLYSLSTGMGNTAVGYHAYFSGNYSNSMALGAETNVTASNRVRIGNTSVTQIAGQVAWTVASDGRIKKNIQENVPGLSFIQKLRPVTYTFDMRKQQELMGIPEDTNYPEKYELEQITQTGLIAQEVEAAAKELNYDFSGVARPANDNDIYGLRYADLIMPLIKGMQEQQERIDYLEREIQLLKKQ